MIERSQQLDRKLRSGPPGARWFIGAVYVVIAVVLAAWASGWGNRTLNTATGPSPSHHTTGAAQPH